MLDGHRFLGASHGLEFGTRIKRGLLSRNGLPRRPPGLLLTLGSVYDPSERLPSKPFPSPGSWSLESRLSLQAPFTACFAWSCIARAPADVVVNHVETPGTVMASAGLHPCLCHGELQRPAVDRSVKVTLISPSVSPLTQHTSFCVLCCGGEGVVE